MLLLCCACHHLTHKHTDPFFPHAPTPLSQDGYIAIEQADSDKRKTKKAIKAWNAAFEENHGRPAR